MSSIDLTPRQRRILTTLTILYQEPEEPVTAERLGAELDRNPGTIRNQMQSLRALQLVESVPGAEGGYTPTAAAYRALDIEQLDQPAAVPILHEGRRVEDATVEAIALTTVHHPDLCRATVTVLGSVQDIRVGDAITVGPTPIADLVIEGTVDGKDEMERILVVQVDGMEAPADTE